MLDTRRTLAAGLLLAILLTCMGCAQSTPTDVDDKLGKAPDSIESQDIDDSEEETLLLRYYPPPNELPKAQVVSEAPVESAAEGIILSADWNFASATPTQIDGIELPFLWPEATSIDASHSVIRFHTDIELSVVFVEGYALLRPDDIGESPSVSGDFSDMQGPIAEYECSRFQPNPCMHVTSDGFVEIQDVPADIFELPHLLVFAKWSIDPEDDPDGLAMANWVFHIRDSEGQPE